MDAGLPATGAIGEAERDGPAVMNGDHDAALREAIDQWLIDLGREEHELRDRLLEVKRRLNGGGEPAPVPGGEIAAVGSAAGGSAAGGSVRGSAASRSRGRSTKAASKAAKVPATRKGAGIKAGAARTTARRSATKAAPRRATPASSAAEARATRATRGAKKS
jgi:hypothetical protein